MKTAQLAAFYFICLLDIIPISTYAQPYVISTDSVEITDKRTGLIWRRCVEGMVYNGSTCTGTASTFTHEFALQHAVAMARMSGKAWRVPERDELASIIDKSRSDLAIDLAAFPATPADVFRSTSSYGGNPMLFWAVNFNGGNIHLSSRYAFDYVRLVRSGP